MTLRLQRALVSSATLFSCLSCATSPNLKESPERAQRDDQTTRAPSDETASKNAPMCPTPEKDFFLKKMKVDSKLKLLWVSLDGLKFEDVEKYLRSVKNPHPKGFQFLLKQKNWNRSFGITNPTITASSHISTLTCVPPGVHGIVSNSQWDGNQKRSGFEIDYDAEGFAQKLEASGYKVAALGYPGLDGRTHARSVNIGSAYDNPKNQSKTVILAHGETSEIPLFIRTSDSHGEIKTEKTLRALVSQDGKWIRYLTPEGCEIRQDEGTWANVFVNVERQRQLTSIYYAKNDGAKSTLFVAPTMINNAYPDDFRATLDAQNLVFSAGKDYSIRSEFGDSAYLKTLEHRLNYFRDTARFILDTEMPEIFFLYLEDLDVLGHQYAGEAQADALRASHFAKLDQALGSIFEQVPESSDVVLLGDHGMSAIQYEVNGSALLPKEALAQTFRLASGGAYFLYPPEKSKLGLQTPAPTQEKWFKETIEALEKASTESNGKSKIFAKVVLKGSTLAKQLGLDGPKMPWVMAFANPGIGITDKATQRLVVSKRKGFKLPSSLLETGSGAHDLDALPEPVPFGGHGHFNFAPEMRTALVMFGPHLQKIKADKISLNIDLVPAVADALQMPRPAGCAKDAGRVKVKLQK